MTSNNLFTSIGVRVEVGSSNINIFTSIEIAFAISTNYCSAILSLSIGISISNLMPNISINSRVISFIFLISRNLLNFKSSLPKNIFSQALKKVLNLIPEI